MPENLGTLSAAAVSIGFLHTLFGPDHYLPFVAMSRVGKWSLTRTIATTFICGWGHVLSSVILGAVGIAFGIVVLKLEHIEAIRGDLAGWLLVTFGLIYFGWGLRHAMHHEPHVHLPGELPCGETNAAESPPSGKLTPWVLFTIFLFGPCEPLIPMLMYPAAMGDVWGVFLVTLLFGLTTIATMLAVVVLMYLGVGAVRFQPLERFGHALAGLVVLACGVAIKFGF